MRAVEFAQKFAGKDLQFNVNGYVNYGKSRNMPIDMNLGKCVGYYSGMDVYIAIIPTIEASQSKYLGPGSARAFNSTLTTDVILSREQNIVYLNVDWVIPYRVSKPQKLYPKTCDTCTSKARKINGLLMCSNDRCKSRKKLLASLPRLKVIHHTLDKNGYVLCPTCESVIVNVVTPTGADATSIYSEVTCREGHTFNHTWASDEKIFFENRTRMMWHDYGDKGQGWTATNILQEVRKIA